MSANVRSLLTLFALVSGVACGSEDARFDVRYAPGFAGQGVSLSIFGVYRDGRMSPEAWDEVGPKLLPWLQGKTCEIAFDGSLVNSNPAWADAIDDYTRDNGVTDELLDQVRPLAKGDTILSVALAGELKRAADADAGPPVTPRSQPPRGRGGRGRRSTASSRPDHPKDADRGTLEMSASLFSVRLRRPVALVQMTYSGNRFDDALEKFRAELDKALPGAVCAGWDHAVAVDGERIRQMNER